jgi:Bacterial SH3 domain
MTIKQLLALLSFATAPVMLAIPAFAGTVPAILKGDVQGSQVSVHSEPSINSRSPHYGLVGDRVTVLESTKGDDGYLWYYVQFPESKAEGWIRGDLVQVEN